MNYLEWEYYTYKSINSIYIYIHTMYRHLFKVRGEKRRQMYI